MHIRTIPLLALFAVLPTVHQACDVDQEQEEAAEEDITSAMLFHYLPELLQIETSTKNKPKMVEAVITAPSERRLAQQSIKNSTRTDEEYMSTKSSRKMGEVAIISVTLLPSLPSLPEPARRAMPTVKGITPRTLIFTDINEGRHGGYSRAEGDVAGEEVEAGRGGYNYRLSVASSDTTEQGQGDYGRVDIIFEILLLDLTVDRRVWEKVRGISSEMRRRREGFVVSIRGTKEDMEEDRWV
ncbi:hypothetical protein B0J14DRAFT_678429 [Halenospora varia]|nr:hypothetical protein B0J14DRAFT_678429 [Halenospora varia]